MVTININEGFEVERLYQLGGCSSFVVHNAKEFASVVRRDARSQRCGGDCQGLNYSVRDPAVARALGAEDTVGGWYVSELDLLLDVEEDERDLTSAEREAIRKNASGEDVYCGDEASALHVARSACDFDGEWSAEAEEEAIQIARKAWAETHKADAVSV